MPSTHTHTCKINELGGDSGDGKGKKNLFGKNTL